MKCPPGDPIHTCPCTSWACAEFSLHSLRRVKAPWTYLFGGGSPWDLCKILPILKGLLFHSEASPFHSSPQIHLEYIPNSFTKTPSFVSVMSIWWPYSCDKLEPLQYLTFLNLMPLYLLFSVWKNRLLYFLFSFLPELAGHSVLACKGHHNTVPHTGGPNNRNVVSHSSEHHFLLRPHSLPCRVDNHLLPVSSHGHLVVRLSQGLP